MNNRLWITLVAVAFVSMTQAGDLKKQDSPSPLDIEAIEREAAEKVAELNAPSPDQHILSVLAALCDRNGYSPTPEQVAKELNTPKNPVSLTKQVPPSPKFRPIAIRISGKR